MLQQQHRLTRTYRSDSRVKVKSSDKMERILLLFYVVLVVLATLKSVEGQGQDVPCNADHENQRGMVIEKATCGPKEVFVALPVAGSYLQISPSSVWVKRCVGICNFVDPESNCTATKKRFEEVHVRIYNVNTNKDSCATYSVEVHEGCRCCFKTPDSCVPPRLFNPHNCSCYCPNREDKKECLEKDSTHRWDPKTCTCIERKHVKT